MDVFEYTCSDCGPYMVVPIDDVRRRRTMTPPFRCPTCGGPVSIDVLKNRNVSAPVAAEAE